jgi:hypothetical protein
MKTGTLWHSYFNELMQGRGLTVTHEVKLDDWLPTGWSGTADWLIWNDKKRAFVLGDLKTTKGEGMKFLDLGVKEEHLWQLSAYWHALRAGNFPMLKTFFVMYLPMNAVAGENVEPEVIEAQPLPYEQVWAQMETRWSLVSDYLLKLEETRWAMASDYVLGREDLDDEQWNSLDPAVPPQQQSRFYLVDELAPPIARVQKLWKNKERYDLKLVPHWSTQFCPFEDSLCDCDKQGTTKIGHYEYTEEGWVYIPRDGYDDIEPEYRPMGRPSTSPV